MPQQETEIVTKEPFGATFVTTGVQVPLTFQVYEVAPAVVPVASALMVLVPALLKHWLGLMLIVNCAFIFLEKKANAKRKNK